MLENCTILDRESYNIENKFKSRKAAKISTYKTFYPKTKQIMAKLRNDNVAPTPEVQQNVGLDVNQVVATNNEVKQEVDQNVNSNPVDNNVGAPVATPINQPENQEIAINFLPDMVYQERLNSKNVTCFSDSKGNKLITTRKLKVNPVVTMTTSHVTQTIGIEKEEVKQPEETQPEVEQPPVQPETKSTFDFSQFSSVPPEPPIEEKKMVESKPTPNIDDYLKKENVQLSNTEDVTVNEITELARENENLKESIETQKEILAGLLQKQEALKVQRAARRQELSEQKLALTQELNDLLAEINQISDIVNEEEASLGIRN